MSGRLVRQENEEAKSIFGLPFHPSKLSFSARWIPTKPSHGQEYANLSYQFTRNLRLGIDWRPKSGDASFLGNFLAKPEGTEWYDPAIILGMSNDDFGTVNSYAVYGTASKHLFTKADVNVSGYAGMTHIFDLHTTRAVGGVVLNKEDWSMLWQYSGTDTHATISRSFGQHTVSFLMFALEKPGVAYTYRF